MRPEVPIACSLDATELAARQREMAALGRDGLIDVRREPGQVTLVFAGGVGDRVAAIAAAEARCCAFLELEVREEPDGVVLEIRAPADAALALGELADAFERDLNSGARTG